MKMYIIKIGELVVVWWKYMKGFAFSNYKLKIYVLFLVFINPLVVDYKSLNDLEFI